MNRLLTYGAAIFLILACIAASGQDSYAAAHDKELLTAKVSTAAMHPSTTGSSGPMTIADYHPKGFKHNQARFFDASAVGPLPSTLLVLVIAIITLVLNRQRR